jgi:hypothetical protein
LKEPATVTLQAVCRSKLFLLETTASDMGETLDGTNRDLAKVCYGFEVICREMREQLYEVDTLLHETTEPTDTAQQAAESTE